jgi:hypothetical protein
MKFSTATATPTGQTLPDVWHVAWHYPDGLWFASTDYPSREAAEAKAHVPFSIDAIRSRVVKDAPEEKIRLDGRAIWDPSDLTVRENWLKRNHVWVAPVLPQGRRTEILTWQEGESADLLRARFGGPAPRPQNAAWPSCPGCRNPMTFVASLDFRGSSERRDVQGDAVTLHRCVVCPTDLDSCSVTWLRKEDDLILAAPPPEVGNRKTHLGTVWHLQDLSWDQLVELPEPPELALTIGHSPYFHATLFGSKIGGHAFWIHSDETPRCECDQPMQFMGTILGRSDLGAGSSCVYLFRCAQSRCKAIKAEIQTF